MAVVESAPAATSARPGRRLWPALAVPGAVGAALVALVLAAATSGAFAARVLADPGALARWGAPVATVLGHLAAAVTVGALLMVVTVLPRTLPARPRGHPDRPGRPPGPAAASSPVRGCLLLAGAAAGVWAVAGAARLVLGYAGVAGESPASPTFGAQLGLFVGEVSLGRMLLATTLLAALTCTLALAVTGPTGAAWTLAVAIAALGILAQTGHAAGTANHGLAVSSMVLHLTGSAVWVGGLAVLCLLARRLRGALPAAAQRYSVLALWSFLGVAISGLVNAWVRVGGPDGLATPYGRLVLAKAAALAVLGGAGWLHRAVTLRALGVRPRLFWRLAGVEVLVMGAVTGLAVALAGTSPPVPEEAPASPTPVEVVTGYPAPPEPSPQLWFTQWRPDLLLALAGVVMVVVYLRWAVRLARRGDRWPAGRTLAWVSGAVVFVWATSGAPAVYGHVLFSAHMLEHMTLATLTPVLFVLGAPVTLALRALPARRDASRGPREWLLALVESRWARFFAHPVVAAVNFAASMVAFYYTALFPLALGSHAGHVLMVVHFSLAGYLFANVLVGIDPGPSRPPYPVRLVLLFATMAFHAFFGVALAQSTALLAADWFGALGLPWGVDALADQQAGANLAWAVGEIPTLVLAAVVAVQWSREDERVARRRDRAADRDGDADLAAYNAMLADLAKRSNEGR